jgi:hypothetical protein
VHGALGCCSRPQGKLGVGYGVTWPWHTHGRGVTWHLSPENRQSIVSESASETVSLGIQREGVHGHAEEEDHTSRERPTGRNPSQGNLPVAGRRGRVEAQGGRRVTAPWSQGHRTVVAGSPHRGRRVTAPWSQGHRTVVRTFAMIEEEAYRGATCTVQISAQNYVGDVLGP